MSTYYGWMIGDKKPTLPMLYSGYPVYHDVLDAICTLTIRGEYDRPISIWRVAVHDPVNIEHNIVYEYPKGMIEKGEYQGGHRTLIWHLYPVEPILLGWVARCLGQALPLAHKKDRLLIQKAQDMYAEYLRVGAFPFSTVDHPSWQVVRDIHHNYLQRHGGMRIKSHALSIAREALPLIHSTPSQAIRECINIVNNVAMDASALFSRHEKWGPSRQRAWRGISIDIARHLIRAHQQQGVIVP